MLPSLHNPYPPAQIRIAPQGHLLVGNIMVLSAKEAACLSA